MGKPEFVGQGYVVPMLRSSRYCEQEYNLSLSAPLIAYYHSLPSAPCFYPVPRRDNPKFLSIYETRPKVQDLVILSTSGLDGVHFDTETCKLNNNLFSPLHTQYTVMKQEQDNPSKHFHVEREEEETHNNSWTNKILRFHWGAVVRASWPGDRAPGWGHSRSGASLICRIGGTFWIGNKSKDLIWPGLDF